MNQSPSDSQPPAHSGGQTGVIEMRLDVRDPRMSVGRPEVMTRKQAMLLGLTVYSTGKPCIYGHEAMRYVSNKRCMSCASASGVIRKRRLDPAATTQEKRRSIEDHQSRKRDEYDF